MTPLGTYLLNLRRSRGIRQKELAQLLGVDASYLSALESGRKGPPAPALLERLREKLALSEDEQRELQTTARHSQKRYLVPTQANPCEHELVWAVMNSLGRLRPAQITAIAQILKL